MILPKIIALVALLLASPAALHASEPAKPTARPNILWLTAEDANVTCFGCYGNRVGQATTPNIDKLAAEGFRYRNAFATAPVCAASRSSWITGIYSLSTGTYHMRSSYAIPHDQIAYYPDALRKAGYFCSNHIKRDYNISGRSDRECWDSDEEYGWRKRKPGQPFFCVINFMESHESRAMGSVEGTRHDPAKVVLQQYHPDVPNIRKNYALYEDAVENMDKRVGMALAELKKAGLEDDTIVIFCTDHGGVMPFSKHYATEAGLHSPFIIRIPEKFKHLWPADQPGTVVDRLVSFVDMPKTWLSMAQAKIPANMQGKVILGPQAEPEPEYVFAYRGRMDERYDEIRVVRDKRYIYIKNYQPYVRWGQLEKYPARLPAWKAWEDYFVAGKCNEITGRFWKTKPWVEELYDCQKDPDCVKNLSEDPQLQPVLARMRSALTDWQLKIHDAGLLPESEMLRRAQVNKTTIYQMVRNPKLYNLPAYLTAADVALAEGDANLPQLTGYLGDPDSCLRYWGACGMVMADKLDAAAKAALKKCLTDESGDVRAMAAWALIKAGDEAEGQACLIEMIQQNSLASCRAMNVIDWMGVNTAPYMPALKAMPKGQGGKKESARVSAKYSNEMREDLLTLAQDNGPKKEKTDKKRGVIAKDEEFIKKRESDPSAADASLGEE